MSNIEWGRGKGRTVCLHRPGVFFLGRFVQVHTETVRPQYGAHEPEVDGKDDGPNGDKGYFFGNAYGHENFQRDILHEKIDCLAEGETNAVLKIDSRLERVVVG